MRTAAFRDALQRMIDWAPADRLVLMCAEAVPSAQLLPGGDLVYPGAASTQTSLFRAP
jgi:hypothetical protein